jgi:TRAP-type mannitol/chloroaromatic compound transport system substrate-binding protein
MCQGLRARDFLIHWATAKAISTKGAKEAFRHTSSNFGESGSLCIHTSSMSGGELFQALEKGTIDATEFSMPAIDQILGFDQIVKNNLFPGWHQPFTAQYMLINGDEWGKTTDAQKALIESVCTAAVLRGLAEGEYKNGAVLAELQAKGINIGQIPIEILQQLKAVTDEVLAEEAAADPDFKRVLESQQEFEKSYTIWDQRAYLPAELSQ